MLPPVRLDEEVLLVMLANIRNPHERRGDLRAQLAAHRLAERRLAELCARRGRERVVAAMDELFAYSERMVRAAIAKLPDGRYAPSDVLEPARGRARRCARPSRSPATGSRSTSPAPRRSTSGNLNCPLAVTRSACVLRRALPHRARPAGVGRRVRAGDASSRRRGASSTRRRPHAVVAGNTETSSRIVDVLFRAFGQAVPVPAQGQGTMNNVTFGNRRFTYYETIGGGQGASPGADGPSAVHVAMSNTLNTPVEALELAYPLRVERYALRLGSGGAGRYRGGDGVIREMRVLEDCRLSVLAERRTHAPQGERGGQPGLPGRTLLNGEPLPAKVTRQLHAGDLLRIETPGGGGFGPVEA